MSYEELPDLPADLRDELPRHAQEIYQAAYNRVYETSMASGEEHDAQSIAEKAHKAALLAVEMEYRKDEKNRWQRAPLSADLDKLPGKRAVSAR
jgi:cation transport regulator